MSERLEAFLARSWHGIANWQWLTAALILFTLTPALIVARTLAASRLRRHAGRTASDVDDVVAMLFERTRGWFFALISLRVAAVVLDLPERWDHRIHQVLIIGGMIQGGVWASALVRYLVDRRFSRHVEPRGAQVTPIAQTLLRLAGLIVVWAIVTLVVLSAFGIDITALVAGLGIGGIALALAVQQVLGDILASISIIVDKPFQPGDAISLGDTAGTVRRIGVRSTVLAGAGGEELVLANNDLLKGRIQNFTRMRERRVAFKVLVVYDTPQELLEALPGLLRRAVERRSEVRLERAALVGLGESGIVFEVAYWMLTPAYDVFVREHQQLLFELLRDMRGAGYRFAVPSRNVYVTPPDRLDLASLA